MTFDSGFGQALALAGVHLLGVLTPGADLAVVLRESIARGRRAGAATAAGVATANLTHIAYALLGLGVLLERSPALATALRWTAAGYLVYLAVGALRARAPDGLQPAAPVPSVRRSSFVRGFLTSALNPKVTLFYLAVFTALLPPATTPAGWVAAAVVYLPLATFAVFSGVSWVATVPAFERRYRRWGHWTERAMGVALLALAAHVVASG